ncbi:hypothetical protein AERO9A_190180 [Aeromonas salmonicida]|nr:hypothetical protein AERO9A_190180 [Aeromonas salmonicida]
MVIYPLALLDNDYHLYFISMQSDFAICVECHIRANRALKYRLLDQLICNFFNQNCIFAKSVWICPLRFVVDCGLFWVGPSGYRYPQDERDRLWRARV